MLLYNVNGPSGSYSFSGVRAGVEGYHRQYCRVDQGVTGFGCPFPDSSDHGKWSDEGPSSYDSPSSDESKGLELWLDRLPATYDLVTMLCFVTQLPAALLPVNMSIKPVQAIHFPVILDGRA